MLTCWDFATGYTIMEKVGEGDCESPPPSTAPPLPRHSPKAHPFHLALPSPRPTRESTFLWISQSHLRQSYPRAVVVPSTDRAKYRLDLVGSQEIIKLLSNLPAVGGSCKTKNITVTVRGTPTG